MLSILASGFKKVYGVFNLQTRLALATRTCSSQKNKYTVKGKDNIIRSRLFQDIPEDCSLYDFITADFSKHHEHIALVSCLLCYFFINEDAWGTTVKSAVQRLVLSKGKVLWFRIDFSGNLFSYNWLKID